MESRAEREVVQAAMQEGGLTPQSAHNAVAAVVTMYRGILEDKDKVTRLLVANLEGKSRELAEQAVKITTLTQMVKGQGEELDALRAGIDRLMELAEVSDTERADFLGVLANCPLKRMLAVASVS